MVTIGAFLVSMVANALDTVSQNIPSQAAATAWWNNNTVWFSTGSTSTWAQYYIQYINRDNDSFILNNYLKGYYYDTQYGFFRLDWNSTNLTENVYISNSTDRCPSGYGYRFDGFAQGIDAGFMDFGYDENTYVYYCESDNKLHGYAYSPDFWLQSFEGIMFSVGSSSTNLASMNTSIDPFFVNNSSILLIPDTSSQSIQSDVSSSDWGKSTIFYIVK